MKATKKEHQMDEKIYISAQALLEDAFKLAAKIVKSGFRPDFIIGIWRGGTPVGIAVQEFLDYVGFKTDHIAIRTASYIGINQRSDKVSVFGLNYIIDKISANNTVLIVDDVFDTGLSMDAVVQQLREKIDKNTPHDIRVAVPWFKPANNKTQRIPDYYLHETDKWLVFPHELRGLTREEAVRNKPGLEPVLTEVETLLLLKNP